MSDDPKPKWLAETEAEMFCDLDVIAPRAEKSLQINGKRYPVLHVRQLPMTQYVTLARVDDEAVRSDPTKAIDLMREKMKQLVTGLTDDDIDRMSMEQFEAVSQFLLLLPKSLRKAPVTERPTIESNVAPSN